MNYRTYFGAQRIQKRLNDSSDDDEDGEENEPQVNGKPRRKATDILAEVITSPTPCIEKSPSIILDINSFLAS